MHYHIHAIDPKAHLFAVTLTLNNASAEQILSLPAWLPGSYMIRDFAKNIINLQAFDTNNAPIAVSQIDKQTWKINNSGADVVVTYHVYAWDLSVRTAHLDTNHGFFNGSSVFLAANGLESTPHSVTIDAPALTELADWKVATSMARQSGETFGFGNFSADSYADLIDHPVEMGDLTIETFMAQGVPHDIVLSGKHKACMARLVKDLTAICEYQIDFFDSPAPFERYVFMTTVLDKGFGGLEHKASTALMCSRSDLPTNMDSKVEDGYRTYLSLCSHEYFHSWNVKRIKPAEFTPFDLSKESYTKQLWAYEGITSYFDDFITYRSGRVDANQYLDMLSELMTRVYRGQGRFLQSLNDSSFNTWTTFYQQKENAANAIVSYYTKGALFALMLDLTLRIESNGQYSLDDVMKILWQQHGLTGIGTQDDSHQKIVEQLLGRDCSTLFALLDSTEDLPLAPLLEQVGVTMTLRASEGAKDLGGVKFTGHALAFGAKYSAAPIGIKINTVAHNSPAHLAGLSAGDILIAADNLQVSGDFDKQLQQNQVGDKVSLHWFRRDELMHGEMTLTAAIKDTVTLTISDEAKLKQWL
ncbi:M61 family metallopeptidase [Shewanella intestini]|uniref:M61 family metallopeptidase n=1 Tax=Shewanella intestini TaxID=2017544 RepID=A0ABS5I6Q5_9GAMM|nr:MULTISPECIES: PDZ domain-containing protein [Shewanella]MBR9729020.1 M61 family metallopeptidase [Shewanella intestini]MRG36914.1 PDZ domain-containing protein [Shewanella sp. XMDDZSB0408]